MTERIERLIVDFDLGVHDGSLSSCDISYTPFSGGNPVQELYSDFSILPEEMEPNLRQRLQRIIELVTRRVGHREFEVQGRRGLLSAALDTVQYVGQNRLILGRIADTTLWSVGSIRFSDLTKAQQRLLDSVLATFERLSWGHLTQKLAVGSPNENHKEVFVSYRATKEVFAAALASRLGQEGITPFFDKWDVKAGDSIAGKIGEAFARSIACVIVLSDDFASGQWATAEMETAVTKSIQEGYKVIPVLYEECHVPELLKALRYVDFSDHDPQTFESKFGELIDAIYGLELNPFRR